MGSDEVRKPRLLCLHGFRTSGEILKTQIHKWPQSLLDNLDLVFVDAPFPCQGKSDVEGIFDPPYYEWFQFNKVPFPFNILPLFFNDKFHVDEWYNNYYSYKEIRLSNNSYFLDLAYFLNWYLRLSRAVLQGDLKFVWKLATFL